MPKVKETQEDLSDKIRKALGVGYARGEEPISGQVFRDIKKEEPSVAKDEALAQKIRRRYFKSGSRPSDGY